MNISVLFIVLFCIYEDRNEAEAENNSERKINGKIYKKNFTPSMSEQEILQNIPYYFKEYTEYYFLQFPTFERREVALETFIENVHKLNKINKRNTSALFKVNEYTIYTLDEFKSMYTGFRYVNNMDEGQKIYDFNIEITDLPSSIDYRDILMHNFAVDQGECKSSYVFSTIGNIEAQVMKNFHFYPNLSLQFAYECEPTGDCLQGGLPHLVMEALMKTPGIVESSNYANYYHSAKLKKCKINEDTAVINVTGVYRFKVTNEDYLKNALALYGPLVIAIHVGEELKNYHSGVLQPVLCNGKPDHAVLLSGYGVTEDQIPYWIIKNSWGPDWGEKGFFRLIRGEWACGIGSYIATATVDINYENNMTVTPILLPQKNIPRSITLPIPQDTDEVTEINNFNNFNNFGSSVIGSKISVTETHSNRAVETENPVLKIEQLYQKRIMNSSHVQRSIMETSFFEIQPKLRPTRKSTTKIQKKSHSLSIFPASDEEQMPEHKKIRYVTAKGIHNQHVKLKIIVNKDDYGNLRVKEMGNIGPQHLDEVIVLESAEAKDDKTDMSSNDFEIVSIPKKKKHTSFQKSTKTKKTKPTKTTTSIYAKTLTRHTVMTHTIVPYTIDDLQKGRSKTKQVKKDQLSLEIDNNKSVNSKSKIYTSVIRHRLRKKRKTTTNVFKQTTRRRFKIKSRENKSSNNIKTTSKSEKRQRNKKNTRQKNYSNHKSYVPELQKEITRSVQVSHFSELTNMHKRTSTRRHKKYIIVVDATDSENDDSAANDDNREDSTTKNPQLMNKEDGENNENQKSGVSEFIVFNHHKKTKSTRSPSPKTINSEENNDGSENIDEFGQTEQSQARFYIDDAINVR